MNIIVVNHALASVLYLLYELINQSLDDMHLFSYMVFLLLIHDIILACFSYLPSNVAFSKINTIILIMCETW